MLKKIAIVLAILVIIVVGLVVAALAGLDKLAKAAIEEGGTYVFEVPTTVETADISLRKGTFSMAGFKVAQPSGFDGDSFLGLGETKVALDTSSLSGGGDKPVVIDSITLENLDLALIRSTSGSNYGTILKSLKRLQGEDDGSTAPLPDDKPSSKQVVINTVTVSDIDVTISMLAGLPGIGEFTQLDVPIDRIVLTDIGKDPENPVDLGGAITIVVQAVLTAIVEKAGTALPADLLADLESNLAQLQDLGALGIDMATEVGAEAQAAIDQISQDLSGQLEGAAGALGGAAGALEGAAEEAGKAASEAAGEAAGKIGEDIKRGIGGLIPRGAGGGG